MGVVSRGGGVRTKMAVQYVHCNRREKPGEIFGNFLGRGGEGGSTKFEARSKFKCERHEQKVAKEAKELVAVGVDGAIKNDGMRDLAVR
jgi:hypothetical protein